LYINEKSEGKQMQRLNSEFLFSLLVQHFSYGP